MDRLEADDPVSFFEPPPPLPQEEFRTARQPVWLGPPDNVLGVGVPIRLALVRTDEVAVLLEHVSAYPTGFSFELSIRLREEPDDPIDLSEIMHGGIRRSRKGARELPPELFRFGLRFADGSKATNIDSGRWRHGDDEVPIGPLLVGRGGGGGGTRWEQEFWAWPLPPEGSLGFVCEWPAHGVAFTERTVDASQIREAATGAEVLWPDAPPSGRGGVWYAT